MIQQEFQSKLPLIIPVLKSHKVKSAHVFGSAVNGRFDKDSDVDLLIEFEAGLDPLVQGELNWQLWDRLEEIVGRKVDILLPSMLTNPFLIKSINASKQLIYE